MNYGTIEKVTDKGFGFIKVEGNEKSVFFHASSLNKGVIFNDLQVGDAVTIDKFESTDKGQKAVGVSLQ